MCEFWMTYYSCGCLFVRHSGFRLCVARQQDCVKSIRCYEWKTRCPEIRKALGKSPVRSSQRLPPCAKGLTVDELNGLCTDCDPQSTKAGVLRDWQCPASRNKKRECWACYENPSGDLPPDEEFELVMEAWPAKFRERYQRKKTESPATLTTETMCCKDELGLVHAFAY